MAVFRKSLICIIVLAGALSVQGQQPAFQSNPSEDEPVAHYELPEIVLEGPTVDLGLQDCLAIALENNLGLKADRLNPDISLESLIEQEAAFDVSVNAEVSNTDIHQQVPGSQGTFVNSDGTDTRVLSSSVGLSKRFQAGTVVALEGSLARNDYDDNAKPLALPGGFSLDPTRTEEYSAEAGISVTQPLLKDFGADVNRSQIDKAGNDLSRSTQGLRQSAQGLLFEVEVAYWELVFAYQDVRIKRFSLQLAKDLLELNKARERVGTAPPLDVIDTEAEVARREELLLAAENALGDQQDRIRLLLNQPREPEEWGYHIVPTVQPPFEKMDIDVKGALETALESRPDYLAAQLAHDNLRIDKNFLRNRALPQLDLFASLSLTGLEGSPGKAMDTVSDSRFNSFTAGAQFSYPLGNRAAKSRHNRAGQLYDQSELILQELELDINRQVREAARLVATNEKRVEASRKARYFEERKLYTQQRSYELGLAITHDVLEFQEDLAQAQSNEIRVMIDYNEALLNYFFVQGILLESRGVSLD